MAPYPRTIDLPGTDLAAREHLAIPMSAALTDEQVDDVAAAIRGFAA
jgi:dTDP-4-amino-4,6-dideoxygalactose transaminase